MRIETISRLRVCFAYSEECGHPTRTPVAKRTHSRLKPLGSNLLHRDVALQKQRRTAERESGDWRTESEVRDDD